MDIQQRKDSNAEFVIFNHILYKNVHQKYKKKHDSSMKESHYRHQQQ